MGMIMEVDYQWDGDELVEIVRDVCISCGCPLDKDALEADRDICFECYCDEQE